MLGGRNSCLLLVSLDMGKTSLIKFQIGPVQDFIAAARSTRDLWSGSYLLGFLVAAGIRKLVEEGGSLIFSADERDSQPLLKNPDTWNAEDLKKLLTPNLPHLFVAEVAKGDAVAISKAVKVAIEEVWQEIARSVRGYLEGGDFSDFQKNEFKAQVNRHLEISWLITPRSAGYAASFSANGWHLDAVRQTRDFEAWGEDLVKVGGGKGYAQRA